MSGLIEKNGKTLHLLKSQSKSQQAAKKRKKVPLLGSFTEYKESKKQERHQEMNLQLPKDFEMAPQPKVAKS